MDVTDAVVAFFNDPLLTVQDVCQVMNKSETTVYNWMNQGLVTERNGDGVRRVRVSELKRFVGAKERNAG